MSSVINIVGESGLVRIEVVGYENSSATNASDANWLNCYVEVRVGVFFGKVDCAFTTHDFERFAQALRSILTDLKGIATFETDEDALQLEIELLHSGTARISGTVRDIGPPKVSLSFSFQSDQSLLSRSHDALKYITKQFPIR